MSRSLASLCGLVLLAGCGDLTGSTGTPADRGIIGKTTQEVGEFNAEAGREVSNNKGKEYDPLLAPLQAYGPILEQVAGMAIDQHLAVFNAQNGRYPKDYAEFKAEIIEANNLQLPVLPAKHEYQYDVENHKLIVVKPQAEVEESSDAGATPY